MPFDVFISYSKHDQGVADAICEVLESRQIRCWIASRNITAGTDWGEAIIDAINDSSVMVFILSNHSNQSPQVRRELERAVHKDLPILPVRIENVLPGKGVELRISTQHWLDAFPAPLQPHLDMLAEHLLVILNRPGAAASPGLSPRKTSDLKDPKDASALSLSAIDTVSFRGNASQLALDPAVDHLVEILPDGRYRPWPLTRPFYSIGRERAKIALPDRHVSRNHVALAQLGAHWVAIQDSRSTKPMHVSGWSLLQRTLHQGDVLRLGKTWLVFVPGPERPVATPLRPMSGQSSPDRAQDRSKSFAGARDVLTTLDDDEDDEFLESPTTLSLQVAGQAIHCSDGVPLVIGSHRSCAVQVEQNGVAPFHCLLCWTEEGLVVYGLGGLVRLDDRPVRKSVVNTGQLLWAGGPEMRVQIEGDPRLPAVVRRQEMQRVPRQAALSPIYGRHTGETALLPAGRPLVLGKSRTCDLALPKADQMADQQLEVLLREIEAASKPNFTVRGLAADVGTRVNGQSIQAPTETTLGDVVQFQKGSRLLPTALLFHFDLASNSWQ